MNFRWHLFWFQDFLKGGNIRKAYKDIQDCFIDGNKNIDDDINNLLKHAKETTNYYKKFDYTSIKNFPVMNKKKIIDNYTNILSKTYTGQKLHKMSTSGSTGTPFTVVQDKRKRNRVIAAVLFFGKQCGYIFGEKQIFLRVWVKSIRKSKLKQFLQNMLPEDISNLDIEKMKEIEQILKNEKNLSNILSYASTLDKLSKYLDEKNYTPKDFSVKSIISGSELLQDTTRERLQKVFGCNIVSRYANEENGILGQECLTEHNEFHLNVADYYFEFLKLDEDIPAKDGEVARIVITDLYNYALPMIRYDTGDLAIVSKAKCGANTKVISKLFGRKVDLIYNTKGEILSPHYITNTMWESKNIIQFKFMQKDKKDYTILLNVTENFCDEEKTINTFKKILGDDANIKIEYTDEIPVLNSGKRKYIENLNTKNN